MVGGGACSGKDQGGADPIEHGGVRAVERGGVVSLLNDEVTLRYDLGRGTFSVEDTGSSRLWVFGAESRVAYRVDGSPRETGTSDPGSRAWTATPLDDALGSGLALEVTHVPEEAGAPTLTFRVELRAPGRVITARVGAVWRGVAPGDAPLVMRLSPLVADLQSGGAIFVGPDPRTHRILDNGSDLYFDFEARVGALGDTLSLLFPPGQTANWTTAVHDPEGGESLIAGFLSAQRGVGLVALDYEAIAAIEEDGRLGFTRFEGFSHYVDGRPATEAASPSPGAGPGLLSELFYLEPGPASPFEGLERFADLHAARLGKTTWTDVPSGWNSWGGGAGSGGLGTSIDATLMVANLEAAAEDFKPYGMKTFMMDDGWQVADGDWWPRQDRFPDAGGRSGMARFADEVRARGMIPGLWISPYTVAFDSQLALEHPDWLAAVSPLGSAVVPEDRGILDLSHPEALDWLAETFSRVANDWGYKFIKMDFSYFALFATDLYDPDVTPSEAYRTALDRIREAIGSDTFLLTISAIGLCMEVADGGRITLDNEPWWGEPGGLGDQGFLTTYVTTARRYYLSHRLWINHPDLLFYRDDYGLTLEEARAWSSVVALTGGIVKLGETYTELHDHPEWRDLVTPLLPVYPRSGRPLDLFTRFYPERWLLPVEREGRRWWALGLFHWGPNRGFDTGTFEEEAPRTHSLTLGELGLEDSGDWLAFDAWEHSWRWITNGTLEETLTPRSARVLVLREAPLVPEVVFTSRHLLGGAVEVHDELWSAASGELSFRVDGVVGDPLTVYLADAGRTFQDAAVTGASDVTTDVSDGVVSISFTPDASDLSLTVSFQ